MAWTSPRTWVAGETATAALFNTHVRDNLKAIGDPWTSYSPTVTQSGTVTKTDTYSKYVAAGKWITYSARLTVTGTGTASNPVRVTLPANALGGSNLVIGAGWILDTSAGPMYKAVVEVSDTGAGLIQFRPSSTTANDLLGSGAFTAALAVGDIISFSVSYEAV